MSSSFFLGCKMDLFTHLSPRFWSQGQPGHSERLGDGDQDCTIIVPSSKGQNWNDVDCNQLNRWVCKGTLGTEENKIHQTH
uniref:C-type lectin domain-containing protein n=1 Tax=Naja naja TaxID=35670 RepID=A0A8C6Y1T5_NAJNA